MIKGIKITKKIKDNNKKIESIRLSNVGDIIAIEVPEIFSGVTNCLGGYDINEELQIKDGFKEIEPIEINERTQRLSKELGYNKDKTKFKYQVEDKTPDEVIEEAINLSEQTKYNKVNKARESIILFEMMKETDIPTILENIDIYPMWKGGIPVKNEIDKPNGIPDRFKHFNSDNELVLYEVIESHVTTPEEQPRNVPNKFKVVIPDGGVPMFVKPTGYHDSYDLGDEVRFPDITSPIYKSLEDNNINNPVEYPKGWKKQ